MQIDYLANWPGLIPELAALLHQEWADLYQAAGIDQAQLLLTGANTCSTAAAYHFGSLLLLRPSMALIAYVD